MMVLDSKSIADAMGGACRKLLRDLSGEKTSYRIQRIGAYSLAPARVTSSVCPCVQGSRLAVFYDDPRMTNSARLQRTV